VALRPRTATLDASHLAGSRFLFPRWPL